MLILNFPSFNAIDEVLSLVYLDGESIPNHKVELALATRL